LKRKKKKSVRKIEFEEKKRKEEKNKDYKRLKDYTDVFNHKHFPRY